MHKLRLLKLLVQSLSRRGAPDPLAPVRCRFLVTPFDVELTRAVSHAYMAWAGLGRWAWSFRNVDWNGMLRERWAPLTHSEMIHYRRSARLLTTVDVTTTLQWWDARMAYLEHRIIQGETLSALVYSRGTFYKGSERLPPERILRGAMPALPAVRPPIVDLWEASAEHFRRAVDAEGSR